MVIVFNHQHSTKASVAYKQFLFAFNVEFILANVTKVMLLKRNETKEIPQCKISLYLSPLSLFFFQLPSLSALWPFPLFGFSIAFLFAFGSNCLMARNDQRDDFRKEVPRFHYWKTAFHCSQTMGAERWAETDERDGPMGVMT